jgi:hypothetical protein
LEACITNALQKAKKQKKKQKNQYLYLQSKKINVYNRAAVYKWRWSCVRVDAIASASVTKLNVSHRDVLGVLHHQQLIKLWRHGNHIVCANASTPLRAACRCDE